MQKRLLFVSFIIVISGYLTIAQEIAVGEWRDHLPYKKTISVTASDQNIYCATPSCLFYYNKNDNSINRFTRIAGLSDIGISEIGFNNANNTLLIAYSNTNIDLVKGNSIINMRDIIESDAITPGEKSINSLLFIGNLAYLSCGFGIVVLNMESQEITDTYYIGPNGIHLEVFDLTYNDTSFFAATVNGIYSARIDSPNLAYFGSWSKDQTLPSPDAVYNAIVTFQGRVIVNKYSEIYSQDTIFYYEDNQWKIDMENFKNSDVQRLKVYDDQLYIVYVPFAYIYDLNLTLTTAIWTYNFQAGPGPNDLILDDGIIWLADNKVGLVRRLNDTDYSFLYPNGPDNADVFGMSAVGNNVWIVPGGRDLTWLNVYKQGSISSFIDGEWNTISKNEVPAFDTLYDFVCIAINPYNPAQVFAGAWTTGMIELDNGVVKNFYSPENSGLDYKNNTNPPYSLCYVGGLAFDNSGYLWATSSHANNVLSVRIPDGTLDGNWYSFNLGSFSSSQELGPLLIDSYNQKWILVRETRPLIVFNDNGTISNTSDDMIKELTSAAGNGALPGAKVFSMAEDKDGEVWVGTDEGIGVFYSPGNIFTTGYNFDAQRILIPRNDGSGLADILLEFETVTAIAVDGDNNKWIGTDRSGVFHLSPDGQIELNHFTVENSPLFSNSITSIVIREDGEVFFGTSKGIISYRGTATQPKPTLEDEDVYAYPNPVLPGYSGPIIITGLVKESNLKITDINGTLIFSEKSEGGSIEWNGANFSGRRAQSGVYLVFIADDEGAEKLVTKILFIN
jgi:hypothetical protein